MCEEVSISILELLKLLVPIVNLAKLLTPAIIIIYTIVDLFLSTKSGNQEQVKKTLKKFPIRITAVILVFMIPSIVKNAIYMVDSSIDYKGVSCLLHVDNDVINNAKYKQVLEILKNDDSDKNDYNTAVEYINSITDPDMKKSLEIEAGILALKIKDKDNEALEAMRNRLKKASLIKINDAKFKSSGAPYSSRGMEVVTYAKTFVGKLPYVWGGTSLEYGADCSGFVQQVYAHFGVPISRTTYTQVNDGEHVDFSGLKNGDYSKLQPGDLIIMNNNPALQEGHVVMYIGNGQDVEEESTNTGCVIRNLKDKIHPNTVINDVRRIIN